MHRKKEGGRLVSGSFKKGQVTFFIIIGIILVLAIAISLYVLYLPEPEEEAEVTEFIEDVPEEFRPVQSFVQQCLYDTAVRGIEEVGMHGGYTSSVESGLYFNDISPTEADGFRIFPNDPRTGIPYWYYFKSRNDCMEGCECSSKKPPLYKESGRNSIESQVDDYIERHISECLRNFESFDSQGITIETGQPESDFLVRQSDASASLKFPVTITKAAGGKTEFENFHVQVPVNLRRVYELAEGLSLLQQRYHYLDRWTIELIEASSFGPRSDGMPPTFANTFDPGGAPVYWSRTDTKNILVNNLLTPNIPLFQVWGTDNYKQRRGVYQKTTLAYQSPTNTSYLDLAVDFEYIPLWPVYYDITGRGVSGEIIGPERGFFQFLSFFGINRYYFYHDISFPVKVDIYDQTAFNGKGYHFMFGLESNIRDNKPLNCSGEGRDIVAAPAGSLLCDAAQSCANISIITMDDNNKPVPGVNILYGAGEESCSLGVTKMDTGLGTARADISMPMCIGSGCTIRAEKSGYISQTKVAAVRCSASSACQQENVLCSGESIILRISKQQVKNITIMKKPMLKGVGGEWEFRNDARSLLPDESAIITLTRIPETPGEQEAKSTAIVNGSYPAAELVPGIVPGKYEVDINLMYRLPDVTGRKEVVFDAITECGGGGMFSDEECFTLGPQVFNDTFIEGGARYNTTITASDLNNNSIIFYAISVPDYAVFDQLNFRDLDMMNKLEELSAEHRQAIQPIFI